jgi:hypothetical protein
VCAKVPDLETCLATLNQLRIDCPKQHTKLVHGYALEELFPAMRGKPTGARNKGRVVGPTFGTIASNEAEVTMCMLLHIRRIANVAEQQMKSWELRHRRHQALVKKLRQYQLNDKMQFRHRQGLTPYVRACVDKATLRSHACSVRELTNETFEVSSSRTSNKAYLVDISLPTNPAKLCAKGCNLNRDGLCHHVMAVLKDLPDRHIVDYVPIDQTLKGLCAQYGVDHVVGAHTDDAAAFKLPTLERVFEIMETDARVRRDVDSPDLSVKRQHGRMKGSWEAKKASKRRLEQEVKGGMATGVDTTPVNAKAPPPSLEERRKLRAVGQGDRPKSNTQLSKEVAMLPAGPDGRTRMGVDEPRRGGLGGDQLCIQCSLAKGYTVFIKPRAGEEEALPMHACGGRFALPPHSGWISQAQRKLKQAQAALACGAPAPAPALTVTISERPSVRLCV